jgi:hypothetical protein
LNDLNQIGKITGIYEFKPGHVYLVLVDGKHFSYNHAHALLAKLEEAGVEFALHVVGTLHPKSIEIHEAEKDA